MINEAGSGHPGVVLGAAPILYTLYAHHLKIDPKNPNFLTEIDLFYLLDMLLHYYILLYIWQDMILI